MAKLFDMGRAPIKETLNPKSPGKEVPNPYAYEHRVTLNADDMSKLGMDEPKVGDVFHVLGQGHVTSVSQDESENGYKSRRVELQMKKMAMQKKGGKGPSMLDAVSQGVNDAAGE